MIKCRICGGIHSTEEHARKISKATMGHPVSKETRKKISIAKKGKTWEEIFGKEKAKEMREKQSKRMSGENHPFYGKTFSEDHKKKLSQAHKGQKLSKKTIEKLRQSNIGKSLSEETKKKISESRKRRKGRLGYLNSPETRKKMSEAQTGSHHTEEAKRKISEALTGRKLSDETREKIREARLKQVLPTEDTSIEVSMQNALKERGLSFETHYPIKGQPDIAFPDEKVAVFCDGCYWHGCPECNHEEMAEHKNDEDVTTYLEERGWTVLRFWGHEIRENKDSCVNRILTVLNRRSKSTEHGDPLKYYNRILYEEG